MRFTANSSNKPLINRDSETKTLLAGYFREFDSSFLEVLLHKIPKWLKEVFNNQTVQVFSNKLESDAYCLSH